MMSRSLLCAILLGLLAAGCGSGDPEPGPPDTEPAPLRVETDKGPVEGVLLGATRAFLGIPFAAPPTGDLRWRPPAPHDPWTEPLQATQKGRPCAQNGGFDPAYDPRTGEDCLTLNIWTPERPTSSSLPVLVWIHGGAFVVGSGSDPDYDGQRLSEQSGAVVVTVNYRLGPLGFLALPALAAEDPAHPSAGMYGIEDQRAALAWVQENIAAFGGDPGNVTLFGESAGGASTCIHLVSPPSRGLFHRAINQSGPCDLVNTEATAHAAGEALLQALGCDGDADPLACARGKSTEEIVEAASSLASGAIDGQDWYPSIDGMNLPAFPSELLADGSFARVPTILGANADEGTLFVQFGAIQVTDEAELLQFAESFAPGRGAEIVAHYPIATYGSAQQAAIEIMGDSLFVCPTRRAARAISAAGVPTYHYHFTYAPPGAVLGDLGAFHSAEVKLVFGNPTVLLPQPLTEEERELSAVVMGYWSRFADEGDPNGGGAVTWPRYDAATDESLLLDLTISTQAGVKREACDLWDSLVDTAP